jgi:hypothetical protein
MKMVDIPAYFSVRFCPYSALSMKLTGTMLQNFYMYSNVEELQECPLMGWLVALVVVIMGSFCIK